MMSLTSRETQLLLLGRQPSPMQKSLIVIGENQHDMLCLYAWIYNQNEWVTREKELTPLARGSTVAIVADSVVVTGGLDLDRTLFLDLNIMMWTVGPNLLQKRAGHAMADIEGNLYVVAGNHASVRLTSIEELSKTRSRWTKVGHLPFPTCHCGVAALGDTILVVGGGTGESTRLIQTFNVKTRVATLLDSRLPRPMAYARGATLESTAFFLGEKGDLFQIKEQERGESHRITSHVILEDFGASDFGFCIEGNSILVIRAGPGLAVSCWDLQGQKTPSSVRSLAKAEMLKVRCIGDGKI